MTLFAGKTSGLMKHSKNAGTLFLSRHCSYAKARRTDEINPANHNPRQIGLFYTIPEQDKKKLFGTGGLRRSFNDNCVTFNESSLMIRQPALEIIDFMKRTDFSRPAIRYVIYGKRGTGKSITLAHVIHYGYCMGFYIVHVPCVWDWFRNNRTETAPCTYSNDLVDFPGISARWLRHFQAQNSHLLEGDDDKIIKISKDYVWNQREMTPVGSSLLELVHFGINRIKYAGAVVAGIISELKAAASSGRCKMLVAISGFNGCFSTATNIKDEDKKKVYPDKASMVHSFLEATKQDWNGGAVVVTADIRHGYAQDNLSYLPIYLLTIKGFEHLDPFIPMEVKEFSPEELHSMLDYYEDRQWLHNRKTRSELAFLSNYNPSVLEELCNAL